MNENQNNIETPVINSNSESQQIPVDEITMAELAPQMAAAIEAANASDPFIEAEKHMVAAINLIGISSVLDGMGMIVSNAYKTTFEQLPSDDPMSVEMQLAHANLKPFAHAANMLNFAAAMLSGAVLQFSDNEPTPEVPGDE